MRLIGIDISRTSIDTAKRQIEHDNDNGQTDQFIVGDMTSTGLPDHSVDAAIES